MLSATQCYAAEDDPGGANPAPKARGLATFKTFIKRKGSITESEVTDKFGPSDSHTPLYGKHKPEPPSWWYYEIENGENIGIAIEDHRVVLVVRRYRNKSVDVLRERASLIKS